MEETEALLSKLVHTKSVEKALAPIASQVSQLILVNGAYERGEVSSFPASLVGSGAAVQQSTQSLVAAARQLMHNSPDEALVSAMPGACDSLSAAGENLVTAAQRLHMEQCSLGSRRHLLRCAKDVLEATLKVLLVTDDAEVRKVVRAAQWLTDRLALLTTVRDMKHLVTAFKAFTEALMLFTRLCDRRQVELIRSRQRSTVLSCLATLKKATPMLSSAMQTFVKYPDNKQAKASQEYAVGQVLESIQDIVAVFENKVTPGTADIDEPEEEPGHFVTTIDKVLLYLSEEQRVTMATLGSDFDLVTEAAVRHSMGVAHLTATRHRDLIIKNCQRILRQRSHLSELCKNASTLPGLTETTEDFNSVCDGLLAEFRELERHVAAAITQLIADVFRETTQPLDRLIKAILGHAQEEEIEELTDVFQEHSDRMAQVARLCAAGSDHSKYVCVIRTCASQLERLDPELVPAARTCQREPANTGAMEHLRLLKADWTSSVNLLVNTIDNVTDARTFVWLSELELREVVSQVKGSMYTSSDDPRQIQLVTRDLIGRCRRLGAVVGRQVLEAADDPMYRSLLKLYTTQLGKITRAIKLAANNVMEQPSIADLHTKLHQRCDLCMKCVSKLREAMDGGNNVLQPTAFTAKGVLNFDDVDEDEEDDDKENTVIHKKSSPTKSPPKAEQDRKEMVRKQAAVKSYIAELTNDQLQELVRQVTAAAVAGQRGKLDRHGNEVLARGNHVCEQANAIATVSMDKEKVGHLHTVVAEVNRLTSLTISLTSRVCDLDTTAVEEMHETATDWAKQVSYLESYVDSILLKWKGVADKVVDAAKMVNIPLLSKQIQLLHAHSRFLGNLVASTAPLVEDSGSRSDPILCEHAQCLQEATDDFENQTTMLATTADCCSKNDPSPESRWELEAAGREWACRGFVATARLHRLSTAALAKLGRGGEGEGGEEEVRRRIVKESREETMRLKSLVAMVTESSSEKLANRCAALLGQCDRLLDAMAGAGGGASTDPSPQGSTEAMYAPHAWRVAYWQWARMVTETLALVDDVTREFRPELAGGGDGDQKGAPCSPPPSSGLLDWKQRWAQGRAKVLEALQGVMQDKASKEAVRKHIDQLNLGEKEIEALLEKIKDAPEDESLRRQLQFTERQWAARCHVMMCCLQDMQGTNTAAVIDAHHFLSGGQSTASPASLVIHGSNEPWWKNKKAARIKFEELHPSQNVTIQDLTGSLLDFADDLLEFDLEESGHDLLSDQSGGFFSADESTKTLTPNPSPPSKSQEKSMDKSPSYASLSRGPKTQHMTPMKPSANSGYKPLKKTPPSKSGYMLASEVDRWEEEDNAIVSVAKEISTQLQDMADYTHQTGPITSRAQLISTAKQIAKNGSKLVSFAKILSQHCVEKRCSDELQSCCASVPTVIAQLSILASVKATADDDRASEKQLLQTAQRLATAINHMLTAAEAAALRGFKEAEGLDESQALILAATWRRRLTRHRLIESSNADTDALGLRKVNPNAHPRPALSQISLGRGDGAGV